MEGFDEVITEFLVESYESLDQLDSDLLALEDAPEDRDRLASIFRTVHTIKGTSGFLALPKLERVAHVGENLLVPLRDGNLRLNSDIADGLLGMVDAIRDILGHVEGSGAEGDEDYAELVEKLQELLEAGKLGGGDGAAPEIDEPAAAAPEETESNQAASDSPDDTVAPAPVVAAQEAPSKKKTPAPVDDSCTESSERSTSVTDSTVRIDVELLDRLMNLVGELVLSRNQILQFCGETDDATMIAASQRLNLITTELQEGVMKTRMQPIRKAWSKLPRVVRDLSASCGKKVEVRMEGEDTELDKTILEAIKDPLTHIVRNSVDHGIEAPDARKACGKRDEGILYLRAFHEGGQVNIEIADDGGGVNTERVREKAIENGIVNAEQAAAMNERELTSLILLPGFSTAAAVTNVSGRGVGMDVVKTNIERIGGTLDINSVPGKGTTLRIKIPLTLAIVPALIVKTEDDQYAIPQVNLLELVRLEGDRAREEIEFIHDVPVYRLRENLLPLVYLDEQLGLASTRLRHDERDSVNIVVLQAEDRQFGLVVDAITDTQEIVVKPPGPHIKNISAYAGTTIMGDGTVALILDVIGIAQKSGVLTEHRDRSLGDKEGAESSRSGDSESLLIVESDDGLRSAIRLSTVSRLETFATSHVEQSGHSSVVQYRGEILPLVQLGGGCVNYGANDDLHTVVYSVGDRRFGVVVGKIVDIVHEPAVDADGNALSRSVIQERVTEFVDLSQVVAGAVPDFDPQWSAA
ncbi:MAG: chemotaxis protein CheA [Planctomycetaceae bacterium]